MILAKERLVKEKNTQSSSAVALLLFFVFKMMGSNIAGRLGNKLGKKTLTAH